MSVIVFEQMQYTNTDKHEMKHKSSTKPKFINRVNVNIHYTIQTKVIIDDS